MDAAPSAVLTARFHSDRKKADKSMKWSNESYWDTISGDLNEVAYRHENAMNAVRLRMVLDLLARHKTGRILDAGCGAGYTTAELIKAGWDVAAIDISGALVADANKYVEEQCDKPDVAMQTPVTDLSAFPDSSFDALLCVGVLYYVEDTEQAYREFNRVLRTGGVLLVSHQNELFDLFTFNRYTRRFFRNHISPLVEGMSVDELDSMIGGMLVHPEAPIAHEAHSARDDIMTRPENPLTFADTLMEYGLEVQGAPYFHGIHIVPPLIEEARPDLRKLSEQKQYDLRQDWRSLFMAAHFLMEARKIASL
jgi:SAM-dependent methyltransferase